MSTRCHVLIKDESDNNFEAKLYHHCDGYPSGVGSELKETIEKNASWDGEEITNELLLRVGGYEVTSCIHGDEEYVYVIDCSAKTLTCYKMDWDDSLEETIEKNRVLEIP